MFENVKENLEALFYKRAPHAVIRDMIEAEVLIIDNNGAKINEEVLKKCKLIEDDFAKNPPKMFKVFNVKPQTDFNQKNINKLYFKVHSFITKRAIAHFLQAEQFDLMDYSKSYINYGIGYEKRLIWFSKALIEILAVIDGERKRNANKTKI